MIIVAGLGNPGAQYANTPHNAGFAVVDALARHLDCHLRRSLRFSARTGRATPDSGPVLLIQPRTFMNNSGTAVAAVLHYYKVEPRDLVVISDDADLPLGRLRVRARGSSGGHRGLESIIQSLGTAAFPRVRVGIGRRESGQGLIEHVLSPYTPQEQQQMAVVVDRAVQAVLCIMCSGVEEAMNRFNAEPGIPSDEA